MSDYKIELLIEQNERLINIVSDIVNLLPDSDKKLELLNKLKDEIDKVDEIRNLQVTTIKYNQPSNGLGNHNDIFKYSSYNYLSNSSI